MKTFLTLLLAAFLLTGAGVFSASGIAYAQCPPTTTGDDTLTNTGSCGAGETWSGQAGNDTLTNDAGATVGGMNGDEGYDLLINEGRINGGIDGGADSNWIVNNGTVGGAIVGGRDDYSSISNTGSVGGSIYGGNSVDHIINEGSVGGDVVGGIGHDQITNTATGSVTGSIIGGEGVDTIVNDGNVAGSIRGEWYNDSITNNGTVGGSLNGGEFDDTIVNTGTVNGVIMGGNEDEGYDTLTNSGTVGGINGGRGNDTITNSGTVTDSIMAGEDDDIINNSGEVTSFIHAGTGNDTITHTGTTGHILATEGDDTVILGDGAVVNGIISGGDDFDVLQFTFTVYASEYQAIADAIAAANPANGSLSINSHTYLWLDFESLLDLLNVLPDIEPPPDPEDPGAPVTIVVEVHVAGFTDGRLNATDLDATAVLFCATGPEGDLLGGIDAYSVVRGGGDFAFQSLAADILPAVAQALTSGENVLIEQGLDVSLWALASGELQANGRAGYTFTFPASVCGLLD